MKRGKMSEFIAFGTLIAAIIAACVSLFNTWKSAKSSEKVKRLEYYYAEAKELQHALSKFHAIVMSGTYEQYNLEFFDLGTLIEMKVGRIFGFQSDLFQETGEVLYESLDAVVNDNDGPAAFSLNPEMMRLLEDIFGKIDEEINKLSGR